MLGTLGCLTPDLLAKYAGVEFGESVWFKASALIFFEGGLDYLGNSIRVHTQSLLAILACQVVLTGTAESYRTSPPIQASEGLGSLRPGGVFDPCGFD